MYTKEERYARFVMAASLYEKFGERFLGDAMEKFREQVQVVEESKMKQEKDLVKMLKDSTLLMARAEWAKQYADFRKYLDAFCAVIYLIEFYHVNRGDNAVPEKLKSVALEERFQDALKEMDTAFLMDNESKSMNFAAREVYAKFMEKHEQQQLLMELCGTSEKKKEMALNRIQAFMCTVKENVDLGDAELDKAVTEIAKNLKFLNIWHMQVKLAEV